jgi:hypothetical protein
MAFGKIYVDKMVRYTEEISIESGFDRAPAKTAIFKVQVPFALYEATLKNASRLEIAIQIQKFLNNYEFPNAIMDVDGEFQFGTSKEYIYVFDQFLHFPSLENRNSFDKNPLIPGGLASFMEHSKK